MCLGNDKCGDWIKNMYGLIVMLLYLYVDVLCGVWYYFMWGGSE